MSFVSTILWKVLPSNKKLAILKRRGLVIGEGCEILNGYEFGSEPYLVEIGDKVRIARGVNITTHDGGVWVLRNLCPELSDVDRFSKVKIGDNCHIGLNATIMPGVAIGNNCVVGAGAVVTHDIPDNSVAVGVPARVIETVDEYRRKSEGSFLHTKMMRWAEKRAVVVREICDSGKSDFD